MQIVSNLQRQQMLNHSDQTQRDHKNRHVSAHCYCCMFSCSRVNQIVKSQSPPHSCSLFTVVSQESHLIQQWQWVSSSVRIVTDGKSLHLRMACENTVIRVKQGRLRGIVEKTSYGDEYLAFRGIPYAKPPLGPLRFKVNFKILLHSKPIITKF